MLNFIFKLSFFEIEISNEDLELFNRCFKHIVGVKRNQFRKIEALIERDTIANNTKNIYLLIHIKNNVTTFLKKMCNRVIEICGNFLKFTEKNPKFKKPKLFFQKMIGDQWRYLYEMTNDLEIKNKANEAYREALISAENDKFSPTDMIYLTFFLNYSVFLHDIMEDRNEAIKKAKTTLHAALRETEEITENYQKDVILLCQTIKDNLSLWKNEMPDEFNI
jgi:hypothetical protein